jgi:hypothetical protein
MHVPVIEVSLCIYHHIDTDWVPFADKTGYFYSAILFFDKYVSAKLARPQLKNYVDFL